MEIERLSITSVSNTDQKQYLSHMISFSNQKYKHCLVRKTRNMFSPVFHHNLTNKIQGHRVHHFPRKQKERRKGNKNKIQMQSLMGMRKTIPA